VTPQPANDDGPRKSAIVTGKREIGQRVRYDAGGTPPARRRGRRAVLGDRAQDCRTLMHIALAVLSAVGGGLLIWLFLHSIGGTPDLSMVPIVGIVVVAVLLLAAGLFVEGPVATLKQ
jgi:hypothetical protein